MSELIPLRRSIIAACDVPPEQIPAIIEATHDVVGIGGYKIGFRASGGEDGLIKIVRRFGEILSGQTESIK